MNRFPLLFALAFAVPAGCQACAMVASNPNVPIRITDESALIVWDKKSHTEHFVRRANFQTPAKNFGFLVPTPSQPQLGAVDDQLFSDLERELLPKTQTITLRGIKWVTMFPLQRIRTTYSKSASSMDTAGGVNSVEVVEQKRVGDYNASILKASDTRFLLKWLKEHRYSVSSDTREWLSPYIKAGYFLTAFQIASEASTTSAQAKAVRLSFKSDASFYPYRETERAQKTKGARTLRVFYVGESRVSGSIDNGKRSAQWPGKMEYSAMLQPQKIKVQGMTLPNGPVRLTAFHDFSSPRPGWGDLRFVTSSDQHEKTPPPDIVYEDKQVWIPVDVVALAALVIVCGLRFRLRNST